MGVLKLCLGEVKRGRYQQKKEETPQQGFNGLRDRNSRVCMCVCVCGVNVGSSLFPLTTLPHTQVVGKVTLINVYLTFIVADSQKICN